MLPTYESVKPIPLVCPFSWRGNGALPSAVALAGLPDAWAKNVYFDGTGGEAAAVKRPGLDLAYTITGVSSTLCQWAFFGSDALQVIASDTVIPLGVSGSPKTIPLGSQAAGGWYRSFSPRAATTLFTLLQSSFAVYLSSSGGAYSQIIPPNSGVAFVPGICELDSSYYVMDREGLIWSSGVATPATWPALNYVHTDPALLYPLALARHLNYIVAFGANAIQMFYNAGISPGSLLARVDNGIFLEGMSGNGAHTLAEAEDSLYWLGTAATGKLTVLRMQGMTVKSVATPAIERVLAAAFAGTSPVDHASANIAVRGYTMTAGGHSFYVLTQHGSYPIGRAGWSLVYDITSNVWTVWTQNSSSSLETEGPLRGAVAVNVPGFGCYLPDINNGKVLAVNNSSYLDDGQLINVMLQTGPMDFGNRRMKVFPAHYLQADNTATTVNLSWSDDDYQTFNTPRSIDMSTAKKQTVLCGSAIRRAWRLSHSANTPLRLYALEVEVSPGSL